MSKLLPDKPDKLWNEIAPLLPERAVSPKGGRPAMSNRACMLGIIFVLKSGLPWNLLPAEMACGSGVTCWRRLREWTEAEVCGRRCIADCSGVWANEARFAFLGR
jgi:transposase